MLRGARRLLRTVAWAMAITNGHEMRDDWQVTDREFHGPKDYLDLARSEAATSEELRQLASSPYSFVVQAVAEHPATPTEILAELLPASASTWNDTQLLLTLASHPGSTPDMLSRIAKAVPTGLHIRDLPLAFKAGIALFERADTPDEILIALLNDPRSTTEFRKVAARQTSHPEIIERLRVDRSERVRRAAFKRIAPE